MNYIFILYFLAGILQDFLFTSSLRLVNQELKFRAASVAFLDNLVSVGVLYNILTKLDNERSMIAIIIYSLGVGTGTYCAMKFKLFEK
ncbi:MAG: hypothetical protein WC822_04220 [Candidatus Paceibacterota bacterium]|jgi:uncharacterized protein YebE (UPF0316 family)